VVLSGLIQNLDTHEPNAALRVHRRWVRSSPRIAPERKRSVTRRQSRLTENQITAMAAGYKAGKSVYILADEFGINRQTVSALLKEHGVRLHRTSPDEVDTMVEPYASGMSLVQVGAELGFGGATVYRQFVGRGVALRGRLSDARPST
jgi:DNA-binding CsgD family transcriptional regulator